MRTSKLSSMTRAWHDVILRGSDKLSVEIGAGSSKQATQVMRTEISKDRLPNKSRPHFLGTGNIKVSFEFFPPKTPEMEQQLWASIRRLEPLGPTHVAITYGAGGSTRDRTQTTLDRVLKETKLKPAAHLTCVGATRSELCTTLQNYWSMGIRHIVAIRGDASGKKSRHFEPTPGGYLNATELVHGVKSVAPFEIS